LSLFRRVTRYRIAPTQDPRENRLTEVTAAVLERVDGMAYDVVSAMLESAVEAAQERLADVEDEPLRATRLIRKSINWPSP
jgi:hypothetical protein